MGVASVVFSVGSFSRIRFANWADGEVGLSAPSRGSSIDSSAAPDSAAAKKAAASRPSIVSKPRRPKMASMNGSNCPAVKTVPNAGLCGRLVLAEHATVPVLARGIAGRHEQYFPAAHVAGHQHQDRPLLRQPRQVVQIAVLSVLVVDVPRVVPRRGAPQDQHRLRPELPHHASPPRRQVVAEFARPGRAAGTPTTGRGPRAPPAPSAQLVDTSAKSLELYVSY